MNVKLGVFEASLESENKVIATWLGCEKEVFGTQYPWVAEPCSKWGGTNARQKL